MNASQPVQLSPGLSDREAIADTLSRCVVGLDMADRELFLSAFTDDAVFDLNGAQLEGLDVIYRSTFDVVARLDTTHMMSNVRSTINADGVTAKATATGVAHHYPPDQGLLMPTDNNSGGRIDDRRCYIVGSLYFIDLVKVVVPPADGSGGVATTLWKASRWRLQSIWSQGDWSVMQGLPEKLMQGLPEKPSGEGNKPVEG